MKEWPLLLSAPMVLARRAGRKTQTRRLSLRWLKAQPGDRLWVRETFRLDPHAQMIEGRPNIRYRATCAEMVGETWRPSIYMPRWACRDEPTVVSVRTEKLQDITEEDARAEGVEPDADCLTNRCRRPYFDRYMDLWDEINGAKAPWKSNPVVVVITMTKEGVK